jgi:hypothetical protein
LVRERRPLAEGDELVAGVRHSHTISDIESLELSDGICVEVDNVERSLLGGTATSASADHIDDIASPTADWSSSESRDAQRRRKRAPTCGGDRCGDTSSSTTAHAMMRRAYSAYGVS